MSLTENVSVLMSRRMERAAGTPLGTPIPILECSEQSSQSPYKVFKLSKRTILIFSLSPISISVLLQTLEGSLKLLM